MVFWKLGWGETADIVVNVEVQGIRKKKALDGDV